MNMNLSEEIFEKSSPCDATKQSHRGSLISLFCGAGGLDIGFEHQGFRVEFAADFDAAAINTYNRNHLGNRGQILDLLETSLEDIYSRVINSIGPDKSIDGIIGGPPCQGFSRGNTARCHTDPRNKLALKYADIVNAFYTKSKLKFFVFENVPEIKAKKNKEFLELLRSSLSIHFNIYEQELNASDFGVPQNRRRYFIVGISKDIDQGGYAFPHSDKFEKRTVGCVIRDLPPPAYYSKELLRADIPHHPNHWTMRPKSKKFDTGEMPGGGRSFIKLDWEKPSRTVAYGNREIHIHPDGRRRLSIYEAMQLQCFPSSYVLEGSLSEQVKQVSNAVPPPVASAIAKTLLKHLNI